jgi:hypothetical protein
MLSTITKTCVFCGKESSIAVDSGSLYLYNQGELAQNAFPTLSPSERELIISGTHSECWGGMFEDLD